MAFVDPNTLAAIFGGQAGGQGPVDPRAARQQALWQALGTGGGQMAQAASQPGATFAGSLGAGAQGFFQGQANAQNMQAQQLQMERMQQKMEAERARQKLMRDLLFDEKDFMDAVDTGGVRPPSSAGGPSITDTRGGAATTPAPQPVGLIARQFESGDNGVGTVSSGQGDAGGVSYGEFQLASDTGTMGAFLQSPEGQPFATQFGDLQPGTDQFNQVYREVAKGAKQPFAEAQRQFIERTHVQPVVAAAQQAGIDTSSRAVQEALFSQAVQHSGQGNLKIINDAAARVGPNATPDQVIRALYDARGEYARQFASPAATTDRYEREQEQVLGLLGQELPGQGMAQPAAAPQVAPVAPQRGGGISGLPDETKRLLAMMDPQDAASAMFQMQTRGPAEMPAAVREAMFIAGGDEGVARRILASELQREAAKDQGPTTAVKTREQTVERLMANDPIADEQAVRNAVFGRYKTISNAVTGEPMVVDVTTGQRIEGVDPKVVQDAANAAGEDAADVDASLAFGAPAVIQNIRNTIADVFGQDLPRPDVEQAIARVTSLGIQGDVLLAQQFSGRVSNQLLDMIGELKANPNTFFQGPARGKERLQEMRRLINRDLERQQRIAFDRSQGAQAQREARSAVEALGDYQQELDSVLEAYGTSGQDSGTSISDDDQALIDKWRQ